MPLVEIKVFEGEFSQTQSQELIKRVTELIVSFSEENLRQATWVVVQLGCHTGGKERQLRGRRQSVGFRRHQRDPEEQVDTKLMTGFPSIHQEDVGWNVLH